MKISTISHSVLSLLTLFIFVACSSSQKDDSFGLGEGEKAPSFEVKSVDGQVFSLQKSLDESKPTVIYFTASWCPTCAKNWPVLSKLYPEYQSQLNLVAVGIDPTDDEQVIKNLVKEKGIKFPITAGNPKVMLDFGVENQATTVGIDRHGNIAFVKNKTSLTEAEYRQLFEDLLAKN